MLCANRQAKHNWKVVWWVEMEPIRGPWRGLTIARRYTHANVAAAAAWRLFMALRRRDQIPRVELWHGRTRVLPQR